MKPVLSIQSIFAVFVFALSSQAVMAQGAATQRSPSLATAGTIDSTALGKRAPFHVYLPPSYNDDAERRYPLVIWLHGTNGNSARAGALISRLFDEMIKSQQIPEVIVAFPDGWKTSMWVDSADGSVSMERYLIEEFLPEIDKQFRTTATAQSRLVEGGSMGGYGAARLGLKYPEVFGAVSMLSAGPLQPSLDPNDAPIVGRDHAARMLEDVYGGSLDYFREQSPWHLATLLTDSERENLKLRMMVGADDPVRPFNEAFSAHLESLGIEHSLTVLPDVGHDPRDLFRSLSKSEVYTAFFSALGLLPETVDSNAL